MHWGAARLHFRDFSSCRPPGPMLVARLHPGQPPKAAGRKRQSGRSSGVEHNLAKVGVEGSNPFARSSFLVELQKLIGISSRQIAAAFVRASTITTKVHWC